MRRIVLFFTVLLLALAGCGGGGGHHYTGPPKKIERGTIPNQHRPCDPSNYYMQCALRGQKHIPLVSPSVVPKSALKSNLTATSTQHGVDFAWGAPSCGTFHANGWTVAATYFDTHDMSKGWSRGLVNSFSACGVSHIAVWESTAGRATNGYGAGQEDARNALYVANLVGMQAGRPIFFAVDEDVPASYTYGYFDGVKSIIGYNRTGAYAGYYVISGLFNTHRISYGWQTYAWSGGNWDSRAHFRQYLNDGSVDYDLAIGADYGQWPYNAKPPGPSHKQIVTWVNGKKAAKNEWNRHGCGNHPLDNPCPHLRRLVTAYQGVLESKAGYKHVFVWGPAVQYSQAVSVVVRPSGAAWLRAAASSRQQFWSHKCNTPHPIHTTRSMCSIWAQRTSWANAKMKSAQSKNQSRYWSTV